MSVTSEISKKTYVLAAPSVTTGMETGFFFISNAHLRVILTKASTSISYVLAINTSYTVSGAGNEAGGTVTLTGVTVGGITPAYNDTVTITRNVPFSQEVDYVPNAAFPASTQERALDQLTMLAQQVKAQATTALRFGEGENPGTIEAPNAVADSTVLTLAGRKGKLLGFNITTGATEFTDKTQFTDSIVTVAAAAAQAAADDAAASASSSSDSAVSSADAANAAVLSEESATDAMANAQAAEASALIKANQAAASAALAASYQPRIEVTTVAALKALATASLQDGWVATVLGYYAAGDNGGGRFRWSAGSSTADNNGTVFQPTAGGGRWVRIIDGGLVNARWFGAKGDNTADDTEAIQRAIDAGVYGLFGIKSGTFAYLPAGAYRITSTLFIGYPLTTNPFGYVTGGIIGEQSGDYPYAITRITTSFATLNRPAIALEAGRGHTVRYISLVGQMLPPVSYSDYSHRNYCFDPNAYANAEVQAQSANQRRYSPYAGIVSNAWSAENVTTSPAPYPSVTIPTYMPTVGGTTVTRGNWPSAQSTIEFCDVQRFDVAVLFNPYGGNNGDGNITRNLSIAECVYGLSAGQANNRQFNVEDCNITFCYCAMTDNTHGFQRGRLYSATNCEIDYCQFWFFQSGAGEIFTLDRCYGEGGGVIGSGERLRLVNCQFQTVQYNNLKFPLIRATGLLQIDGIALNQAGGGGGVSGPAQHWSKTSITPYVIVCSGFEINNISVTAPGAGEPTAIGYVANSFVSDLDVAPATTLLEENKIICAQVLNLNNSIVILRNNGLDISGESLGRMRSMDVRGAGVFQNRFMQNAWFRVSGSTGGTLSQRFPMPFWFDGYTSEPGERIPYDGMYSGASVTPNWSTVSALVETTDSFTSGGITYQLRNLYVDVLWTGTRRLRKGWMYAFLVGTLPVIMVAIKNPTETGVANTWRFKIIFGFDGRGEFAHGLTLPTTGTIAGNNPTIEYKPTRCVNYRGRVIATFTSGSNVVTLDTSTGFDATLFFKVDDVIYASDPRVQVRSGAYQQSNGAGATTARITAISSASSITLASNSPVSTTCEIWLN